MLLLSVMSWLAPLNYQCVQEMAVIHLLEQSRSAAHARAQSLSRVNFEYTQNSEEPFHSHIDVCMQSGWSNGVREKETCTMRSRFVIVQVRLGKC